MKDLPMPYVENQQCHPITSHMGPSSPLSVPNHIVSTSRSSVAPGLWHQAQIPQDSREKRLKHMGRRQRSHINIFDRWMRMNVTAEERLFENLPPNELDQYLETFFRNVKRRTGEEFSRNSLFNIRTSLMRYLREVGYPHSITSSGLFVRSQLAFKFRTDRASNM